MLRRDCRWLVCLANVKQTPCRARPLCAPDVVAAHVEEQLDLLSIVAVKKGLQVTHQPAKQGMAAATCERSLTQRARCSSVLVWRSAGQLVPTRTVGSQRSRRRAAGSRCGSPQPAHLRGWMGVRLSFACAMTAAVTSKRASHSSLRHATSATARGSSSGTSDDTLAAMEPVSSTAGT